MSSKASGKAAIAAAMEKLKQSRAGGKRDYEVRCLLLSRAPGLG